jgi:ribosome-associated protein
MTKHRPIPEEVKVAVGAAEEKQAVGLTLLDLGEGSSFTDYFLIAGGRNIRQCQAIADEVQDQLSKEGLRAMHVEGYPQGEWILLDFGFLVVHVFSEKARAFYDLERLWRTAHRVTFGEAH